MKVEVVKTLEFCSGDPLRNSDHRIVMFSDSHMGDRSKADNFDEKAFKWFLSNVVKANDVLVGLGDITDIWESSHVMFRAYAGLLKDLYKNPNFVYVVGNHDMQLSKYAPVFCVHKYCSDGILGVHGNDADIFNSKFSFIGAIATKFNATLERLFGRGLDHIDRKSKKINSLKTPAQLSDQEFGRVKHNYWSYMSSLIDGNDSVFMGVFGHTHRLEIITQGTTNFRGKKVKKIMVNCGDFVGTNSFVLIHRNHCALCRVVK